MKTEIEFLRELKKTTRFENRKKIIERIKEIKDKE